MTNTSKQITVIGSFVLGAIILLVALVLTMGGNKWARDVIEYDIYFTTSVKGLAIGAPVMFRGIAIGEVSQINLAPLPEDAIHDLAEYKLDVLPVEVSVKIFPERLGYSSTSFFKFLPHSSENIHLANEFLGNMILKYDLRAELETLSLLTGQIYIALNFVHSITDEPEGFAQKLWDRQVIPSHLSLLDMMAKKMKENGFTNKLDSLQKLFQDFCEFIDKGEHRKILENFSTVSTNISNVSMRINETIPRVTDRMNEITSKLNETITKVNEILDSMKDDLPAAVTNTKDFVGNLNGLLDENRTEIKELIANLNTAIVTAQADMEQAQAIIANLRDASAENSPERQRIQGIMNECDQLMIQLHELLDTLNKNPQALILGK